MVDKGRRNLDNGMSMVPGLLVPLIIQNKTLNPQLLPTHAAVVYTSLGGHLVVVVVFVYEFVFP